MLHRPSFFIITKWHTDKHCCLSVNWMMLPTAKTAWCQQHTHEMCAWNAGGMVMARENLSQWHSAHQKSHWLTDLWLNPGLHHHRLANESWYYTLNTHTQNQEPTGTMTRVKCVNPFSLSLLDLAKWIRVTICMLLSWW